MLASHLWNDGSEMRILRGCLIVMLVYVWDGVLLKVILAFLMGYKKRSQKFIRILAFTKKMKPIKINNKSKEITEKYK